VYINARTTVLVTCPKHGDFPQTPNNHLSGNGCLKCAGFFVSTGEEFIELAAKKHQGRYRYAHTVYVKSNDNVKISCPEHGDFLQTPNAHLIGHGCPTCFGNALSTTEEFIERAAKKHGGKYAYSKAVYAGNHRKITITCPLPRHRNFEQTPNNHLHGNGCPKCSESTGERTIRQILSQILADTGADFIAQYRITECRYKRPLPFDFAVREQNVVVGLIEYHGEQHYGTERFFGLSGERATKHLRVFRSVMLSKSSIAQTTIYFSSSFPTGIKPRLRLG
jgi:hypothetical protein